MKIKMPVTKTYSLSEHKQLVDLNGDFTNFDLTFTATSKDKSAFNVLVVDQTTLDNTQDLKYKVAEGEISGNIISDKNVYQNYFLVLKADKPVDVVVTIDKKEIQPAHPGPRPEQHPASIQPTVAAAHHNTPQQHIKPHPPSVNWKLVGIVAALVIGGVLFYFYYNRESAESSGDASSSSSTSSSSSSSTHTTPISTHTSTPSSTPGRGGYFDTKGVNNDLLNRINRFPIR